MFLVNCYILTHYYKSLPKKENIRTEQQHKFVKIKLNY